jgi:septal ring factor EnvC (AmiA/AmiB activator)
MKCTPHITRGSLLLLLLFAAIEVQIVRAQESDTPDKREQLETIQQQLKEKQTGLEQIKGKERNLLKDLRSIDRHLKESQQTLQDYRNKLAKNREELKKVETNLSRLRKKYEQKNKAFAKRLRAIYKMGDLGYLTPFFTLSSQTNVQRQMTYLQRIAESDRKLMEDAEEGIQAILKEKAALEKYKREIVQKQQEIEQQNLQIAAQRKQKTELLEKLVKDKDQFALVMKELEESAEELEEFLDDLGGTDKTFPERVIEAGKRIIFPANEKEVVQSYGQHFRANKGKLLWPVQGRIITNFGLIEYSGTYTHSKGVDIQAKIGTPFYSVFKGTVKYADWFDKYGNLVIVDHGGNFYTLYAHADELSVKSGDFVETRQVLGKVGDTESIKGASLHFEIRANGEPEDPLTWMARVE